ncbi:MAG: hypothetical protein IT324_19505 [Anaerolineae bacterium]|nr:hypothetical protein [Anaerolineae bacterium]
MNEARDVTDELIHIVQANEQVAYMLCDFPAGSNQSARQIGRSLSDDYWADHTGCAVEIQFADGYKYMRLDFSRMRTI